MTDITRRDGGALTAAERDRFTELEAVVERGRNVIGLALREIRDSRLYRETHATFADYLRERWGMSRSYGYRQIAAARVLEVLSPDGDVPANEAQMRELAPLLGLEDGERRLVEVWRELRDTHGIEASAPLIRQLVLERYDRGRRRRQRRRGQRISRPPGERWREMRLASVGDTRLEYIVEALTEASELMGTGWTLEGRRNIARRSLPQLRNLLADVERWADEGRESC